LGGKTASLARLVRSKREKRKTQKRRAVWPPCGMQKEKSPFNFSIYQQKFGISMHYVQKIHQNIVKNVVLTDGGKSSKI
jgi:hypothetical protein